VALYEECLAVRARASDRSGGTVGLL